jgi:hypothetical protein
MRGVAGLLKSEVISDPQRYGFSVIQGFSGIPSFLGVS